MGGGRSQGFLFEVCDRPHWMWVFVDVHWQTEGHLQLVTAGGDSGRHDGGVGLGVSGCLVGSAACEVVEISRKSQNWRVVPSACGRQFERRLGGLVIPAQLHEEGATRLGTCAHSDVLNAFYLHRLYFILVYPSRSSRPLLPVFGFCCD